MAGHSIERRLHHLAVRSAPAIPDTAADFARRGASEFTADIPLTRGGAISGRIYDASGDSVAGLQVRVYRATMEQGARRLKAVGAADLTDDTGAFRVYGLPPGDYYVAASLRVAPHRFDRRDDLRAHLLSGHWRSGRGAAHQAGTRCRGTATFPLLPVRSDTNLRRRAERMPARRPTRSSISSRRDPSSVFRSAPVA